MSYIMLAALATAIVGAAPLALRMKFVSAAIFGVVSFFITWGLYYLTMPTTVYPLFGSVGFVTAFVWVFAAIVDGITEEEGAITWTAALPVGYAVVLFGTSIFGWSAFNAQTYATMIGAVEKREWTQDVQPKDPRHMLMVSAENAHYLAKKMVGQGGTIGSQFSLSEKHMTLQRVRGELVYVTPFDFKLFSTWTASKGAPGYIVIYGEDPERQPHYVQLPAGKEMNYMPDAYFGYNLERHLRNNGFLNDGLFDFRFELDEEGQPYWIISTYKLDVWWWAERVTGVATVNPTTGEIHRYSVAGAPEWIDRIYPSELVKEYLTWNGLYSGGWLNSWWHKLDLVEPENPNLIYSSEDRAEWVVGVTSTNDNDDSLIGITYVDSRTGRARFYAMHGGATDEAVLKAVNANQQVKYKSLHGTNPQTYNVYGTIADVVPLLNSEGAYQGVAIAPLMNVQEIAVGVSQSEALRNYQASIFRRGQQIALEKAPDVKELTGIISRIRQDVGTNGSVYHFHVEGVPRIFTASSQDHVKLSLTQPGDSVTVRYIASGENVVPVQAFDNLSLPLDKSEMQKDVERAAEARVDREKATATANEILGRIRTMSPAELKRLEELLRK